MVPVTLKCGCINGQDAKVKSFPRGPGAAEGPEGAPARWLGSGLPEAARLPGLTGTGMDSGS